MLQNHENFHVFQLFTKDVFLINSCTYTRGKQSAGLFLLLHLSLICSHLISVLVVAVCGLYEGMHGVYQFLLNRISISKVTSRSWDSVAMSKTGRNSLKFSGTRGSGSLI